MQSGQTWGGEGAGGCQGRCFFGWEVAACALVGSADRSRNRRKGEREAGQESGSREGEKSRESSSNAEGLAP